MRIGVLALQGAFIEHQRMLEKLGAETFEIRNLPDLNQGMDALVLPGGESTVMYKIMKDQQMVEPIKNLIAGGLPVMGTCAGLLLLAKNIHNWEYPF
ncbi:MAG: pyridoxal 5'-phosphate synthase glutaminase subunit PdxT, partial [Candidatus Izemoplasmatales bacterium]|nr:pyridoxal 5'-phosphate synthase glutaminase subunit PdxT [Candidatus Izemoplasmatales bacterium]